MDTLRWGIRALLILIVLAGLTACHRKHLTGDDLEMFERAKVIGLALNTYHQNTAEWPERLRDVQGFLAAGKDWPVNPYNGQPIEDTESREFDPQTSVGMVFYEKFYRDEQILNYQLHVFGDKGKLHIFSNTAFGLKE